MQDIHTIDPKIGNYAGFGIRIGAWAIDFVILAVLGLISSFMGGFGVLLNLVGAVAYQAGFESSQWQATPGKMVCGLIVTDIEGNRVGFARAVARNFGMTVSNLTLGIGYLMILKTHKRQALHDKIANCVVLKKAKVLGCGGSLHEQQPDR